MVLIINKCGSCCILSVLVVLIAILASSFILYKFTYLEVTPPKPWNNVRLSPSVKPFLYELWLYPNLNHGTFNGTVSIFVNVEVPQSHISVHIKGLQVTTSKLYLDSEDKTEIELRESFEYSENEFWILEPVDDILPNRYKLFFEFNGKLTNKIVGFYQSTYRDGDGEERRIATSKFEPTFARQAFPCFDEPGFKAKFDIELVKPSGNEYIALSNMHQLEEIANKPSMGFATVKFGTTFPMSTYLACFIVCDFDYLEAVYTRHGFPIAVFARKEYLSNLKFARDAALKFAEFYCDYFNVSYPLPKLDLIAIPDFVSGAMENWGLITFRETRLLCDDSNSSAETQLGVALTVAHEISHMWFGDLVTMKWWNDLWLNEGFATFMEYKAVAKRYPSWELDNVFISKELYGVLRSDSTLSSHPIILPVNHPDQITEIFDGISYSKGASVIRMLEMTVGEEEFRKSITAYLEKYRFLNAETNDLWEQLDLHSNNINVTSFMDTWTRQMGFPVINVHFDRDKKEVTFRQKRFLSDSTATYDPNTSPYGYKWEVPITYMTSSDPRTIKTSWLRTTDEKTVVPIEKNSTWLKVNFHHIGYYVVNYDDWVWKTLHALLRANLRMLDAADRANLLYDAFLLAEADQLPYETALNLTNYLPDETHYLPWSVGAGEFFSLHKKLYGTEAHNYFKIYVRHLIKGLRAISWNVDDRAGYLTKTLQTTILYLGCEVENKTCLHQAVTLFKQWLSQPAMKLHPELASIIMYYGIKQTTEKEWDELWDLYLEEDDPQGKIKMMKALTATKEPKLIERYLQYGKNESYIRSQDYLILIVKLSLNPTANPLVWDFVRKEWPYLVEKYTLNDRYLGNVIPQITSSFSTETRLAQMKEFFLKYPEAGAGANGRKRALERINHNLMWRQKHLPTVTKWFKETVSELPSEQD